MKLKVDPQSLKYTIPQILLSKALIFRIKVLEKYESKIFLAEMTISHSLLIYFSRQLYFLTQFNVLLLQHFDILPLFG